jgi:hypothetical protein
MHKANAMRMRKDFVEHMMKANANTDCNIARVENGGSVLGRYFLLKRHVMMEKTMTVMSTLMRDVNVILEKAGNADLKMKQELVNSGVSIAMRLESGLENALMRPLPAQKSAGRKTKAMS